MKSIFKKIHVSSFLIFVIFLSFISGLFRDVISFFLIIIIHEIGHGLLSFYYGWKIEKIEIGVCGGFITYDEVIDKPFKEELIIALSGIFFQSLFYFVMLFLNHANIIDFDTILMIRKYHYAILLFNLLPVYPLDGSKVLSVILNVFLPYKKSLKIINYVSFLTVILTFIIMLNAKVKLEYNYVMIMFFVMSKLIEYHKNIPYLFNRFLFERYEKKVRFKKYKLLKKGKICNFMRQKKHYYVKDNHYVLEDKILAKRFD